MKLNNIYNFKNKVKFFLNVDNMIFPSDLVDFDINCLAWTKPINFRIYKEDDQYRTIRMPNMLNFVVAYEHFKDISHFKDIRNMDSIHKRLSANVETGDFSSGVYECQLNQDFNNLCIYDNLLKLDIKEYYGRLYTHNIDFQGHNECYLTNMNLGATNGLLVGNYLSLYFAERNLADISKDIEIQ